jgi:hypothetical protein
MSKMSRCNRCHTIGEEKEMKKFVPYGIAGREFSDADSAKQYTYTKGNEHYADGSFAWPSTKLIHPGNPFNDEIFWAKNILEIGCGCGRNMPWVMEGTEAHYWGIDPNPDMLKYFWDLNDQNKHGHRVHLCKDFSVIPQDIKFDVVFSVFVFQHLGFRTPANGMNVVDITREAMKHTRDGAIWWVFEHEREEPGWVHRWLTELDIQPEYWRDDVDWFEYLNHRHCPSTLVIFKEKKV